MSLREDVTWVIDAVDMTLMGGLPCVPRTWSTVTGKRLWDLVTELRVRYVNQLMEIGTLKNKISLLERENDGLRNTNERLTNELEELY